MESITSPSIHPSITHPFVYSWITFSRSFVIYSLIQLLTSCPSVQNISIRRYFNIQYYSPLPCGVSISAVCCFINRYFPHSSVRLFKFFTFHVGPLNVLFNLCMRLTEEVNPLGIQRRDWRPRWGDAWLWYFASGYHNLSYIRYGCSCLRHGN